MAEHYDKLVHPDQLGIDGQLASLFAELQGDMSIPDHVLRSSIQQHGVMDPVVVWRERNVVVDGHRRVKACRELGIMVPVRYVEFSSIEDALQFARELQASRRNLQEAGYLAVVEEWKKLYAAAEGIRTPVVEELKQAAAAIGADWNEIQKRAESMSVVDQLLLARRLKERARKVQREHKAQDDQAASPTPAPSSLPEEAYLADTPEDPEDIQRKKAVLKAFNETRPKLQRLLRKLDESVRGFCKELEEVGLDCEPILDTWQSFQGLLISVVPEAVCPLDHQGHWCSYCGGKGWLTKGESDATSSK